MVYTRSTKSKTYKTSKTVKSSRKSRKAPSSFKKSVKTVIKSMAERMYSPTYNNDVVSNIISYNTAVPSPPAILNLLNPLALITQGDGQGSRSGNQITLSKMMFRALVSDPRNSSLLTNSLVCKFVIARLRSSVNTPVLSDFQSMFQDGNSTDAINNSLLQQFTPFNKDLWDIKKTIPFKLNNDGQQSWTPLNGFGQYFQFSVDVAKYLPKKILYNDTTVDPTNCGLYGFFLMADPSGTDTFYYVTLSSTSWAEYYDL